MEDFALPLYHVKRNVTTSNAKIHGYASEFSLGSQNGTSSMVIPGKPDFTDTLRALIIFTQFKDDTYNQASEQTFRQWPLYENRGQLPPFADHILSTSPEPPFPDSSLTAYFYEQSLGNFLLYGEVYDSVLVSDEPEARYHRRRGGYGDLTKELLDKIDRYGFDFTEYDQNEDGYIDYIFVVLRGDSQRDNKRFVWTGASCLDGRCSGTMAGGGPRFLPEYDGIKIDWEYSGSYIIHRTPGNIIPQMYHVRLMAHELGHDLVHPYFVHIPSYQRNDVPASHNRNPGKDCIAYMLMAGAGGAWDCAGSQTISAFERDFMGWIDCKILDTSAPNLILGDLYTTSDCYKIQFEEEPLGKRLYLSNLQRISPFDRLRSGGMNNEYQMGLLRTTGMLAVYADGYRADILPADNNLQLANDNASYKGDLYDPTTATQITPWTRPNSNGYNAYPANYEVNWAAIDNIRFDARDSTKLVFDFHSDFRQNPVIREDSWMSSNLDGFDFSNSVKIMNGATLTIEQDVIISGALLLDRNSKIVVSPSGTLRLSETSILQMNGSAKIEVAGKLVLDGMIQRSLNTQILTIEEGVIQSTLLD